jgi:alanine dehydrogenase
MNIIGIPKEIKQNENRISLIPDEVKLITNQNIKVYIQKNAGINANYTDDDYIKAGAILCETIEEIYNNANLIIKVKEPQPSEYNLITDKHIIMTFFHFAGNKSLIDAMIKSKAICIAYETIQLENGYYPILAPMSIIAGKKSMMDADFYINQKEKDKLVITIIGVGNVGRAAVIKAKELGYKTINLIDKNYEKIKELEQYDLNIYEMTNENLMNLMKKSNIIIGSVYNTGKEAPKLITKDLLDLMPNPSIFMDVAIDQGGMTELSEPTTIETPLINYKHIKLYCVPNIPSNMSHEASKKLSKSIFPYINIILNKKNVEDAMNISPEIKKGVNIYKGDLYHDSLKKFR